MSTSAFANLKKSSKKGSFETLSSKLNNNKKDYEDNSHEFWKLTTGKDGNGYAVIRFLPASEGEETPVVKKYVHSFKGPGGWYIQNDPSTIGQKSYVYEATKHLWGTKDPADEKIRRERKRQTKYIANILVLEDPAAPENEGKVFKYLFGSAILKIIDSAIVGDEIEGIEGFNPFDFWNGANFKIRAAGNGPQRSYDKSRFTDPAPLFDGDEEQLENLYKKQYKLQDEIAENKFKSYEEQKRLYLRATGETDHSSFGGQKSSVETDDFDYNTPSTPAVKRQSHKVEKPQDDDDDDLSQYASLLNDD